MEKIYKDESVENKVVKRVDLNGEHGEINIGVVECEDGFRIYAMKDGKEQAAIGVESMEEADEKIAELAELTGSVQTPEEGLLEEIITETPSQGQTVTIGKLQYLDWNQLALYGDPEDPKSWQWGKAPHTTNSIFLGSAQEIFEASTWYDTGLIWEMETEEGDEGYEEECERREEWESEKYEIVIPATA